MDVTISDRVQATVSGKIHDNPLSIFILAIFCGILMFTAVEGSRKCREEKNFTGSLFVVVMPVMVFIICGFNHCIADMFYFSVADAWSGQALLRTLVITAANGVGGVMIPLAKKWKE